MTTLSRFPVKDADFNDFINIVILYLITNKTRLVLTPAAQALLTQLTAALNTANTGWNAIYPLSQNPATSTVTIVGNKNAARELIETGLRSVYADIPQSVLTQADRDTLNLPLRSETRSAVTKPVAVPSISVNKRGHLSVTVDVLDSSNPQSTAKPKGVRSIEIEGAFLSPTMLVSDGFPKETDFRHLDSVGRTSYTRNYTAEQLKGTEYLRARYLSPRNEPGNWSEWISVIVA